MMMKMGLGPFDYAALGFSMSQRLFSFIYCWLFSFDLGLGIHRSRFNPGLVFRPAYQGYLA